MFKFLSFLAITAVLGLTPKTGQPDKEFAAKATIQEWQILISNQDDVPKNARDKVVAKIATQLQLQINADTIPKKK